MALGLSEPWYVSKVEFIDGEHSTKELHLWLSFKRGHRFTVGGIEGTAYDTIDKTWRHLNFFEHLCYLHASVPRVKAGEHGVVMVDVPWARKNSGFTLLFEAYAMLLIEREMPVSSVSRTIHETAPRVWRMFNHWVRKAVGKIDMSRVRQVGVDETSKRKGHNYITQFVDLDTRKTIFVTEGKDASTFEDFSKALVECHGKMENIEAISMDMSQSFISGALSHFPKAGIIFDKFHIFKALNESLDTVRKAEHAETRLLKGHRFTLLYNRKNLSPKKAMELDTILMTYPTIGKAYGFRESFSDIFNEYTGDSVERLERWCKMVEQSAIKPMVDFVAMVRSHMFGIKNLFAMKNVNNGILEGLNSQIQLAKKRARGFVNTENFKYMVYFVTGGLKLDYPHDSL
nr:ISL3 family transposase [uncultured Prevotella sp.]